MTQAASLSSPDASAPHRAADFAELQLCADDGTPLAARHYPPRALARGAVLLAPAMGVPQRFYEPLASWLAGHGFSTLSFDYRGMGASRRASLRGLDIDIVGWGERDAQASLDALRALTPGLPLTWIGHSLGGQIVPFVREHRALQKVITVAAGSGYWRDNSAPLRRKVWIFWWGAVPMLTPLFGYFPGQRLGMVGDLPRGVVEQWRRWCLHPEYALGDGEAMRARFAAMTTPITSLSFSDDEMMSEASIAALHRGYTGAAPVLRRFTPRELGVPRVGHFGFFREAMRAPLWERLLLPELAAR